MMIFLLLNMLDSECQDRMIILSCQCVTLLKYRWHLNFHFSEVRICNIFFHILISAEKQKMKDLTLKRQRTRTANNLGKRKTDL